MKKIYKYAGELYHSSKQVRQAIWDKEHKVFGNEPTKDKINFWSSLGVDYTEEVNSKTEIEQSANSAIRLQIRKLKNELQKYDYIGVKIATQCATVKEYETQIAKCQQIRQEINALEAMLNE